MPDASRSITIDRPIGDVFAFLANAENDKQWRSGVIEMTRTGGEGVGTTYRQIVSGPGGRRIDADLEITEFVQDQRIGFKTTKGPVRPTGRYDLERRDGGTQLTFRLDAKLSGLKMLMAPMVTKAMRSEVGELAALKRVLESR
jgi:carbon monoxide dehydrogenase subunit G